MHYGLGRHTANLTDHQIKYLNVWFWTSIWLYYLALLWAKLSILTQYSRIFVQETFQICNKVMMTAVVVYSFWTVFSAVFACTPIQFFWHMDTELYPHGKCLNRLAVWYTNAALNIISDIIIAAMPLPLLHSLNVPKRSKVAPMVVFGLVGMYVIARVTTLATHADFIL